VRRAELALATMAVALLLTSGVALAAAITGTDKDEILIGTRYADSIHAKGGQDVVRGLGGADKLYGNQGKDRIVGGRGEDRLYGGNGDDRINSMDLGDGGIGDSDVVDCGPGRDFVKSDFDDRVLHNCEGGVSGGF
jgi:Ca2+-binding RTX toxin-like protein